MMVLVVLDFEVGDVEDIPDLIETIDPPSLPGFLGTLRIIAGPYVEEVIQFLDEDE